MRAHDAYAILNILSEIEKIDLIIGNKNQEDLENDLILERAVSMSLGLISEKVGKFSKKVKEEYPEIEWEKFIGLKNYILENCEDLDLSMIYRLTKTNIPEFKEHLLKIDLSLILDKDLLPIRINKDQSLGNSHKA